MPFLWYRDIPVWGAGVGTAALAVIALTTLGPLIENLELRDRNLELAGENRQLQERIKASQKKEHEAKAELRILNRQREAASQEIEELNRKRETASEEIKHLQGRQDRLLDTLEQISGNISEQTARVGKLRTRLDQLENEARQLRTTRNKLEARNKQLEGERVEVQDRLRRAEKELGRVDEELKNTYRVNRRYILEQIATKVTESVAIRGEGSYDDYIIEVDRELTHLVWFFAWAEITRERETPEVPMPGFQPSGTRGPKNGRQLVLLEFGSQIFRLLPEAQKPRFQDAIRGFMDKNSDIFSANLVPNVQLYQEFYTTRRRVQRIKGSKYFDESVSKPEEVPKHEIEARELAYEKAKSAIETDVARFHSARIALHEAMERMVVGLTDIK